jgi:hypothetical protein
MNDHFRWRFVLLLSSAGLCLALGCARVQPPDLPPDLAVAERMRVALGGDAEVAAVPVESAAQAEPTGWATLTGSIKLTSQVGLPPQAVDKDTDVCGTQAPNETVVCGPNNELKNVLVFVATKLPSDAAPWVHESYAPQATATVAFDQKNCIFLNHVFAMRATQKLKVLNSDTVGHNTSIGAFGYNRIIPAKSSDESAEPKATEPTEVSCSIHPWMKAWLFAGRHPYFAVTNDAGEFKLENVPAGVELEFRFWQEKVKYIPAATVNGLEAVWPKGKMKLTLANDEQKKLDIVLDAARFQ